jgi:4-amino-4-deoxy-L-arabinose transferase-like glycosyltransferase
MLAAGLLFLFALRAGRQGRTAAAAAAIVAAGLVLRLYAGCDLFLHAWDERFHALVAKHLMAHPLLPTLYEHPMLAYDYRNWRANHVWLHKPPLALWLMAASLRVLGVDEIALRLPSLLLSTVAVFMTFVAGACWCGRRAGLLAAGLHAANGYLLQLPAGRVAVDHVDNALGFCVELGIFLAVLQARSRRWWWAWVPAIGAATGLAVLAKWLPGLLVIPVWLALAWGRKRPAAIAVALCGIAATAAAVALPWQLYIGQEFPLEAQWESAYNLRHLFVPIEGLGGSPLFHLLRMPRYFGELIYLPVAWFLWQLVRGARRERPAVAAGAGGRQIAAAATGLALSARDAGRTAATYAGRTRSERLALAAWLLIPYVAFSFAATKLGGYVMLAAPALFIVAAGFWFWLWDRRPRSRPAAALRWAVLGLLLLLPLRYTIERLKVRAAYDRNPPWARALRALPARLGPGPIVLFHLDEPLEAMFYTPFVAAYERVPTPDEARRLLDSGYRVVVLDAAAAPPELRGVAGIELLAEAIPAAPLDDGTGFRLPRANGTDSPLAGSSASDAADVAR